MASAYAFPDNTDWVTAGTGPMDIQAQYGPQILVNYGTITKPATYDAGPHFHLDVGEIHRYTGIEHVWFRVANNNVANITQKAKVAYTPVTV